MKELKERIRKEGKVLPGNIIKIDGFLNHRVDPKLMRSIVKEFMRLFKDVLDEVTMVMTVEASGIPLGTITAEELGVPMVFAKKAKSDNIEGGILKSDIYSYTYKKKMTLLVSGQWIGPDDKVLVIDDFLANGEALSGVVDIIGQARATLVGMGVAVEKGFQGGGDKLRGMGVNLKSLAIIESADDSGIVFREDPDEL